MLTLSLMLTGCFGCSDQRDLDRDGFSPEDGDCDEEDPSVHPDAEETWYNGIDENCDGNDGDQDGDGFVPDHYVEDFPDWADFPGHGGDGDCWDVPGTVPSWMPVGLSLDAFEVNPGAYDIPKDGADQDCAGDSDYDEDEDGHDCIDGAPEGTDCDDTDPEVHPGAEEVCNGKDDDCDGVIDEVDSVGCTDFFRDEDGDGFGLAVDVLCLCEPDGDYRTEEDGDCDDHDPDTNPDGTEVCDDLDNDCDGSTDEDAVDAGTWYLDNDGDGVGSAEVTQCDQPTNGVDEGGDCDDTDVTVFPGSAYGEIPNDGIDQDCDGNDFCTDLDCDGIGDVVLTHFYDSTTGSYRGYGRIYSGASGWQDFDAFNVEGGHRLLVEDLNGDGYQDIVVANHYNDSTFLINSFIYWGNGGDYTANNRTKLPTAAATWAGAGDFNGDGYTDLAFSNHHDNSSYVVDSVVFYGSASGIDGSSFTDLPTLGAYELLVEDLDGDGYDDLVYANTGNDTEFEVDSIIYWGGSAGLNTADTTELPTTGAFSVASGDVNGDGYTDLAFSSYIDDDGTYALDSFVYLGSSSGYSPTDVIALDSVGAYWVRIADLNADGYDDVVLPSYYNGGFNLDSTVYYGSASGPSTSDATDLPTKGAMEPLLVDLDQDGYGDIVFSNARSNATYSVDSVIFWGASTGFSSVSKTELETAGAQGSASSDLDGDGYLDLVFSNYLDSTGTRIDSLIYWGSGSGWSDNDRTELPAIGNYAAPVLVP